MRIYFKFEFSYEPYLGLWSKTPVNSSGFNTFYNTKKMAIFWQRKVTV